ncbi:MAG: GDYXXLXY domain-containing protein [Elusimicrobiota bacterium]
MTSKLRAALIIQLAFFTIWGGYLLTMDKTAGPDEIYLETEPVDPRDLLSGTYVALNYAIGDPQTGDCRDLLKIQGWETLYVNLRKSTRTVTAQGKVLPIYEAANCAPRPPSSPDSLWARGRVQADSWRGPRIYYGIEKFFLNENDPLKDARSGSVTAKVKLDRANNLHIEALLKKDEN